MSIIPTLKDSSERVASLFKHDLSVFDLSVDETHNQVSVTARYTYDLSKVFSVQAQKFNLKITHERVKESLEAFIAQVNMGIEHDLINKFPHLKEMRPVTFQSLKEQGLINEMLEFERLLDQELKTNVLSVVIRARLTQMHDKSEGVFGRFQYDVELSNTVTGSKEQILLKTEQVPFSNGADAELYAKRFIKGCQE